MSGPAPLVLCTAGHIDHGKTALVRALTGTDTDRLGEEKRRGISIELGYAVLELPSGRAVSVIDVPGHERFVRTMVAGATGIDLFVLCVAADDGVMPQTREHLSVLRALDVSSGVVAITKCDATSPERASREIAELLPETEIVAVSARSGSGIDELTDAIERVASALPGRAGAAEAARLHIDRSFTLHGIGTVVTGTLCAGTFSVGGSVTILPQDRRARIRAIEVHDESRQSAGAGQRVALNLAGIDRRELDRGDLVCAVTAGITPTFLIDVAVTLAPHAGPIARGTRIHVHHGTRAVPARLAPLALAGPGSESTIDAVAAGERAYCQLRLAAPLMPVAGDRVVLRLLAPPDTIGGGVVIDPAPRKHGPSHRLAEHLRALEHGTVMPAAEQPPAARNAGARPVLELDDRALSVAEVLLRDGPSPRADGELASALGLTRSETLSRLRDLERAGTVVRVAHNLHFHAEPLEQLKGQVLSLCEREGRVTVARLRDELATSRRYAQALLEHLDAEKVMVRRGDEHFLRTHRR